MPVVPVVIAPQRSIALLGIRLNWLRPSKVRVIPDEGEESVVGDVQWGKVGRFCNTPKYIIVVFSMFRVFCRYDLNFS